MNLDQEGASRSNLRVLAYHQQSAGRGPMLVGLAVLIPILLVFAVWAAFAPLNAAAIASGEIVLGSHRKTIQHLEGGLVTEIFFREGERVSQGEPLLVIQDLAERSRKEALIAELINTRTQVARLVAERDGLQAPDFSAINTGIGADAATVFRFSDTHLGVFRNLTETARSVERLADSRKKQIRREIEGLQAQLEAKNREADLVRSELARKRILLERKISTEVEVNALARTEAVLDGEIGAFAASIAKLEQSILDQDEEVLRQRNERASALLGELQEAQLSMENIRHELRTLKDRQTRAVVRAPVSGVILGMQVHTVGAVVAPGSPLMDIVPAEDDLIIEAKVNPTDIDLVVPGMNAKVQLSAYKARSVEKIDATVETVSGDIVQDELTGERYFLTRLRATENAISSLPENVELSPGMPADVFLISGERTMAEYLLSPVLDAAHRAFREE